MLTLQVKKIPPELNNIAKLNEHFAAFGSIVNMQVILCHGLLFHSLYFSANTTSLPSFQVRFNGEADSALITYASRGEAMAAYKSPQPVLNNRFIKVFFYNPDSVAGPASGQDVSYSILILWHRNNVNYYSSGSSALSAQFWCQC